MPLPPCISTSRRTSVSPMPSPPWLRSRERSDCLKRSNTRGISSGSIPTPLSCTRTTACRIACIAGIALSASLWTIAFAAVLGFSAGGTLALSLTLPALLRPPADIAATSAAMFVIGYTQAVIASVVGGAAWDLFGAPAWAFLPIALMLLPLVLLPGTIQFGPA